MTATKINDDTEPVTALTIKIRIPRQGGDDLTAAVERRLERIDGVATVTVNELHAIEPRLAATLVRTTVTIEIAASCTETAVQARIADTFGIDLVESGSQRDGDAS